MKEEEIMSAANYEKAYKLGKKDLQYRQAQGLPTELPALDDILPAKGSYAEIPLGLVQIPLEQIVGTKTRSRSNAFSANFMPTLDIRTEFAGKWMSLFKSHMEEGIRNPIKAYEYMNKFYVEEGNKRVSVLKYFDVTSIVGDVIRIVPKQTEELENKIYYEFLDFYEASQINYIWFTKEGGFKKLQTLVGKKPGEIWTEEECVDFRSIYTKFKIEYIKKYSTESSTVGDAFLALLEVYGYKELCAMSMRELLETMEKIKEEFVLLEKEEDIELKLDPTEKKKISLSRLLSVSSSELKIAFIYEKTVETSAWTYAHELGRLYLEETFVDDVTTISYDNVTRDTIVEYIEKAIGENCNIIFTTTPTFAKASVKAAIEHPEVRILNCSVNTSHRYIRTYYTRLHEAKFLMGAIAGAMAENDKVTYIADYPIYGTIANINAFALGAKMINPRVKVHLEWSSMKNCDISKNIDAVAPACVSGKDVLIPGEVSKYYGVYHMEDGKPNTLATPLINWGKFYEQLIRAILDKTWKKDAESSDEKAINYWWGMSAGVIDVVYSRKLPIGTLRLVELLKETICRGEFNPFSGILYSQEGIVQDDPEGSMTPEEIVEMDWLAENVIGHIPTQEELREDAIPLFSQQGIDKK